MLPALESLFTVPCVALLYYINSILRDQSASQPPFRGWGQIRPQKYGLEGKKPEDFWKETNYNFTASFNSKSLFNP